jgi:hypothetical protein
MTSNLLHNTNHSFKAVLTGAAFLFVYNRFSYRKFSEEKKHNNGGYISIGHN